MYRFISFLLLLNVIWCDADLSTKFKICSRSDPNLNACLKVAIKDALAVLKNGFPDLNILPLEPIRIADYVDKELPPLDFVQKYSNVELHDHVSSEIQDVNAVMDDTKFSLSLKCYSPSVHYNADYEYVDAVLGGMDISSKGKSLFNATGFKFTTNLNGEIRKNGDKEYIFITNVSITDADIDNIAIKYESADKPDVAKVMTEFFNSHWHDIIKKSKPKYTKLYGVAYKNEANSIFARIPYSILFPK